MRKSTVAAATTAGAPSAEANTACTDSWPERDAKAGRPRLDTRRASGFFVAMVRPVSIPVLLLLLGTCAGSAHNSGDPFTDAYWEHQVLRCVIERTCGPRIVDTPTISPGGGAYTTVLNVSMDTNTSEARICYTTDGQTPACSEQKSSCALGSLYSATVSVTFPVTLTALGCRADYLDSAVASGAYAIDASAPGTPTTPTATPISTSRIDLSWTAASDDQTAQAAIVYEICRSTGAGICATFVVGDTSQPGATVHESSGLSPSTTYFYRVRARDAAGNASAPTGEFSATTAAVGTISAPTYSPPAATYTSSQSVSVSSASGAVTICVTTDGSAPACDGPKTGCTTGTLYSTPISVTTSQTLRGIACSAGFTDSSINNAAYTIDTVAPTTPGSPGAAAGIGQINVTWTAASDNITPVGGIVYEICKSTTNGGCNTFAVHHTSTAGATGLTISGLSPLTTYYFRIRARDAAGNTGSPTSQVQATVLL